MAPTLIRRAGIMCVLSCGLTASLFAQDATTGGAPSTPSTTSTTSTPGTTGTTPVPAPTPAPDEGALLPEVTPLDEGLATARGTLTVEDGGFFRGEELVLKEEDGTTVKIDISDDQKVEELKKLQGQKIEIRGQIENADQPESQLKALVAYQVLAATLPGETAATQPVIPQNELASAPTAPQMEMGTPSDAQISTGTPTSADDPLPPESSTSIDPLIAPTARTQPLDVEGTAADQQAQQPLAAGGVANPAPPIPPTTDQSQILDQTAATPPVPSQTQPVAGTAPAAPTIPAQQTIIGRIMKPLGEDKVTQKVGLVTEEGDKYLISPIGRGADLEGLLGAKVRVIGKVVETAQLQQPPQPAVVQDEPITEQLTGDHEEKAASATDPAAIPPVAAPPVAVPPVKDAGAGQTAAIDEVGTGAEPPEPPLASDPQERGIPPEFHLSFKDAKSLEVESFQVLEMAQGQDAESPAVPLDTGMIDHPDQPGSDVQPETTRQTLDERESTGI